MTDLETRITKLERALTSLVASGGLCAPLPSPSRKEALNDEQPADDEHPPTQKQLRDLEKKNGKAPGHYGADASADHVEEFGDVAGHAFHGNQYTGAPEGIDEKDLKAAHNWHVKEQRGTGDNYQSPHGVSEDTAFGGHVVEHGGYTGGSEIDRKGNTVSSSMFTGKGFVNSTGGARWRAEMAGDKPNAERIWRNRDLISAGMVEKLGPQGAFNGARIGVKFHDDGTATVGDYDSNRWNFDIKEPHA